MELKTYKMVDKDYSDVYLKSDADELLRRQKYKRCAAIARWLKQSIRLMRTYECSNEYWDLEPGHDASYYSKKGDFYSKWRHRWLNIAEQFKEVK